MDWSVHRVFTAPSTRAVTEFVGLSAVISTSFACHWNSDIVPVTISLFVNFLSRAVPKMFPSVCQDMRGRMSALSFATERAKSRSSRAKKAVHRSASCRRSPIKNWEIFQGWSVPPANPVSSVTFFGITTCLQCASGTHTDITQQTT